MTDRMNKDIGIGPASIKKEAEQLVHSHIAMTLAGLHLLNFLTIV
jgi:hypothetical protein